MKSKQAKSRKRKTENDASNDKGKTSGWTFLNNHALVLAVLHSDPKRLLREVAIEVGITERAVQRIIQDLAEGGFIERERVGRQNRYRILKRQPLRHPIEGHLKIGNLLKLITGE